MCKPLGSGARGDGRLFGFALVWLLTLGLWLVAAGPAGAAGLNLSWSAPATNEDGTSLQDLAGYRVYYGYYSTHATEPPCNSSRIDAGKATNYQLTGLTQGSAYYMQVTALDTAGNESGCSAEASGVAAAQTATLSVTRTGAGVGTVTSSPAGIACGADCAETYPGNTVVSLTASAAGGSTFTGWGGACSGSGTCSVTMSQARSVSANFTLQAALLSVSKAGTGGGTVTSSPAGIACGTDCAEGYPANTTVTLTAVPAGGSVFAGWSGPCAGTGACTVTMSQWLTVTATFNLAPASTAALTVSKGGPGSGTVTSSPAGITCGTDCSESYPTSASVRLTAAPAAGSVFAGWSGACTGTGTCTVSMGQARTATATFGLTGSNGLVAAYSLNAASGGTVPDASGNGWSGTVSGAWATAGRYGNGLAFDGANDLVDTRYAANLPRWTVSVWVRSPAAPSWGRASGPVHREKNFQINWNHENAAFRGAAAVQVNGVWHAASFGPLAANTWYHLTATYDGETLRAYRNGVLVSSNSSPSGSPAAESATMKLGRHAAAAQYFRGTVDEVRVYNRALSQAEIQAVMTTPLP
ncbi:MAG: LamG-like jellyroll fold domain-containing protein [Candidatus Methylomirabilales bacterium]